MDKKVIDDAQEKAAKLRLMKVEEEETAKLLARGGKIKNGPRVAMPMSGSSSPEPSDLTEIMQ